MTSACVVDKGGAERENGPRDCGYLSTEDATGPR
jgi:hypothetical protein